MRAVSSFLVGFLLGLVSSVDPLTAESSTKEVPLHTNSYEDKLATIRDAQAKNILRNTVAKEANLDSVLNLRLDNAQISTVEGFGIFSNLTHLSLSGNFINNIVPLTQLSRLKTLDLSKNLIVVPSGITSLEGLESLNLSNNRLKYAFCCSFISLIHLKLDNNNLQQLIFINNFNKLLEEVDVSHNPIKSITIRAPLPSLKRLNANGTFITQVDDLVHLQALEELHLKNCIHLRSITALFRHMEDHWECKLNNLKKLSISEEFLDNTSKAILADIKKQKNNKPSIL